MCFIPNLTNLLPDDGNVTTRRTEAPGRPREGLVTRYVHIASSSSKKYVHHVATRCHRPTCASPQLSASLHDLTPDRRSIRNRFTLRADNYAHNRTNYAFNNKSLSMLTPRYYQIHTSVQSCSVKTKPTPPSTT